MICDPRRTRTYLYCTLPSTFSELDHLVPGLRCPQNILRANVTMHHVPMYPGLLITSRNAT